jgi:hypothetical protein
MICDADHTNMNWSVAMLPVVGPEKGPFPVTWPRRDV